MFVYHAYTTYNMYIDKHIGSYWYIFSLDILVLLSWACNKNPVVLPENLIHTICEIF